VDAHNDQEKRSGCGLTNEESDPMPKKKPVPTLPNVSKELYRYMTAVDALIEYAMGATVCGTLPPRTQKRLNTLAGRTHDRQYNLSELFYRATGIDD
jgi:hypothetical protein